MKRINLVTLKVLLVLLLIGSVVVQLAVVPLMAWFTVQDFPEFKGLAIPYVAAAVLAIAAIQVVLVATWRLVGMVGRERIFDPGALPTVTLMVHAAQVATLITAIVALHLALFAGVGPATVPLAVIAAAVAAAAVTAVLVVLRALLSQAIANRLELEAVV